MTKLDVLSGLGDIEVVTGYRVNGERFEDYPAHLSTIDEVETEVETLPGWAEDISGARSLEELPETARAYVERVEKIVGVPICMLSVGAERDAVIQRSSIFEDGWVEEAAGDAPVGAAR